MRTPGRSSLRLFSCHAVVIVLLAVVLLFGPSAANAQDANAQEKADHEAADRIREAALNHSQITDMLGYFTDVIGPRLTGSPNLKRAEEYALGRLREWGLQDAHLEAWGPFGRGWTLTSFTANMISPQFSPMIAYPKAWSPGTNGAVRGEPVFFDVKTATDLENYRGKLRGKIVLFAPPRHVDPLFEPPAHRQTDEELSQLANAPPTQARPFQFSAEQRQIEQLNYRKWEFIRSEGAAVVLQPSFRDAGTLYVTSATVPYPPDVPFDQRKGAWDMSRPGVVSQVVVAAEQYNRLARLVARGIAVELEINVGVRFYDDDPMSYNVIAQIPGTDLKDQVVMVGGCIDSWHAGTGATDNAAGAATALEVVRILEALKLKPRRTIRIGLWSAEEQGALGSRAYVAAHFGKTADAADGQPGSGQVGLQAQNEKFDAYFNFDYGTGRIRGIYLQGNEAARPIFRTLLEPFKDLGASTLSLTGLGGDHASFDEVNLPGFQWIRDYMEGNNTRAAHTNMDTYDHVLEEDLKQSAAVAAYIIYELAVRDDAVPRKPAPAH
jgi:carboxypeptidase Q